MLNLTLCWAFSDVDYYKLDINFQIYVPEDVAFIFKWKVEDAWYFCKVTSNI